MDSELLGLVVVCFQLFMLPAEGKQRWRGRDGPHVQDQTVTLEGRRAHGRGRPCTALAPGTGQ